MIKYNFYLNKRKRPHHKTDNLIGLYGIYIDDELVYIGKTSNSFLSRYSVHKSNLKIKKRKMYSIMYQALEDGKEVYLSPLIICDNVIKLNELEKSYIEKYQPRLNIEGIAFKYRK